MSTDPNYVLRLREETQARMEEFRQQQIERRLALLIVGCLLAGSCIGLGYAIAALNFQ